MDNDNKGPFASDQVKPDPSVKIHWANTNYDEQLELLKSRNWITETMIEQYAKLWHCDRKEALERVLAQSEA